MSLIRVKAELPGRVCAIVAEVGDAVAEDAPLVMIESMKMEIPMAAPTDGTVKEILVQVDDEVSEGQDIAVIEA
jgi:biotin carboxyl carrier protein